MLSLSISLPAFACYCLSLACIGCIDCNNVNCVNCVSLAFKQMHHIGCTCCVSVTYCIKVQMHNHQLLNVCNVMYNMYTHVNAQMHNCTFQQLLQNGNRPICNDSKLCTVKGHHEGDMQTRMWAEFLNHCLSYISVIFAS